MNNKHRFKQGIRVKVTQATFGGFFGQSGEVVAVHSDRIKMLPDSIRKPEMNENDKLTFAYWFYASELTEEKE